MPFERTIRVLAVVDGQVDRTYHLMRCTDPEYLHPDRLVEASCGADAGEEWFVLGDGQEHGYQACPHCRRRFGTR